MGRHSIVILKFNVEFELHGLAKTRNQPHITDTQIMKIEFDPQDLDTIMQMWRDTIDLKIPIHDDFKIHFMQNRGKILRNYERTASGWSMMFSCMTPAKDENKEFALTKAKIEAFREWTKEELSKLDAIAMNEDMETGVQELLDDPVTRNHILKLMQELKGKDDDTEPPHV